tara:strand:+ start:225 stop:617 length:393 start_codon:yes stop_codon:yes gene_type:complete
VFILGAKIKTKDIYNFFELLLIKGVNVNTKIRASELKLIYDLCRFIEEQGQFHCSLEDEKIILETLYYEPLAEIEINKSILHITPINDENYFTAISAVMNFFYQQEKSELETKQERKNNKKIDPNAFEWI